MCGRYVSPDQAAIERFWHIGRENSNPFPARYNVPPRQGNPNGYIPIIRHDEAGRPELIRAQWWLLPFWSKESRVKYSSFNARAETVATAAAFRAPFQRRRCLVPALGWYEWQATPSGKQPWYMHSADGELLHFAGLWDRWTRGDESIESCTIIVQCANPTLAAVHDRMPVILPRENHAAWLDRELIEAERVSELLRPVPQSVVAFHRVSKRVSNARNEGADLIKSQGRVSC